MKKDTQKVKPKIESRERDRRLEHCLSFWMQWCLKLLLLQTLHSIPKYSLFNFSIMTMNRWIRHAFPGGSEVKASACNVGDLGSIPGSGRSPGEGSGTPLQYSCLKNPMDGGAWWATVHEVAKSWTRLSHFTSLHFWSSESGGGKHTNKRL